MKLCLRVITESREPPRRTQYKCTDHGFHHAVTLTWIFQCNSIQFSVFAMIRSDHFFCAPSASPLSHILGSLFIGAFLYASLAFSKPCESTDDCLSVPANPSFKDCAFQFCEPSARVCLRVSESLSETPTCNTTVRLIPRSRIISVSNSQPISTEDRQTVIRLTSRVLRDFHPHRLLHLRFLNVDPVEDLHSLADAVDDPNVALTNVQFHERMKGVFEKIDDFHTTYTAPSPLKNAFALLPFAIADYFESGDHTRRFVLTDLARGYRLTNPFFIPGVHILTWNGEHINTVVERVGFLSSGSNAAARIAAGITQIRIRRLGSSPFPMEDTVVVGFLDRNGVHRSITVPWLYSVVINNDTRALFSEEVGGEGEAPSDPKGNSSVPLANLHLFQDFNERSLPTPSKTSSFQIANRAMQTGEKQIVPVNETFSDLFTAEVLPTAKGPVGRLVLSSFNLDVQLVNDSVREFARVLTLLPDKLIVDIRKNGGGLGILPILYTELLTDKPVDVPTLTLRATGLTSALVNFNFTVVDPNADSLLLQYRPSMNTSRMAGDPYTGALPLVTRLPEERLKRVYMGRYLVVADPDTYSAGDIFASTTVDNELATLVVENGNVGAGGSSVNSYSLFSLVLPELFPPMPANVDFSTSSFRVLRSGKNSGAVLENFGILGDVIYRPTLRDRLTGSRDGDLFEKLAEILDDEISVDRSDDESTAAVSSRMEDDIPAAMKIPAMVKVNAPGHGSILNF